jgi:hypothetical protein
VPAPFSLKPRPLGVIRTYEQAHVRRGRQPAGLGTTACKQQPPPRTTILPRPRFRLRTATGPSWSPKPPKAAVLMGNPQAKGEGGRVRLHDLRRLRAFANETSPSWSINM